MTDRDPAFDCSASAALDRLKERLALASDRELAVRLGVPTSTIATWRWRNSVAHAHIVAVCVSEGVDIDWILTGRPSPWTPGRIVS